MKTKDMKFSTFLSFHGLDLLLVDGVLNDRFLQPVVMGRPDPQAAGDGLLSDGRQLPVGGIRHNGGDPHGNILPGGSDCLVLMGGNLTCDTVQF